MQITVTPHLTFLISIRRVSISLLTMCFMLLKFTPVLWIIKFLQYLLIFLTCEVITVLSRKMTQVVMLVRTVSCRLCWNHWFSLAYARRKLKLTPVPSLHFLWNEHGFFPKRRKISKCQIGSAVPKRSIQTNLAPIWGFVLLSAKKT